MSGFKVHFCLSELYSALGLDSSLAEKHVEDIQKSCRPFVTSQNVMSQSLKILTDRALDSESFMSKYDELKSQNIHNLDAVIVLLAGINNSNVAKSLIEAASVEKFHEDGFFGEDVAIYCPESQIPSSVKLTQDELNTLRDRLLRESQLNDVSINSIFKDNTKQKTACNDPPIPEWLYKRPYLTMDFIYNRRDACLGDIGPLGEVAVASQECQLIEDLLYLMTGIQGTYITVSPPEKPFLPPVFKIDPSVEISLKTFANRILPICGHYSLIIQFIEEKNNFTEGLVNQALAAAMRNLVKDYLLLVTQLESQHNKGFLTLHKLAFYIEKTLTVMEMLSCLAASIRKSHSRGGAVLSLLHERTLSLTGCGQLQDVFIYLTQAAAQPYMNMLSKWIYRGIICDPYLEFMVKDTENQILENRSDEEFVSFQVDLSDDYWEKRYTLDPQNIPIFLQAHAEIILRTGKYLNVIRQSDGGAYPDHKDLVYSSQEKSYIEVIEKTCNFASKKLLQLLMKDKDLMGRLRSVKHYLLLDQGDFVVQLLSLCESELSKNIDDVVPTRLESLLELALRTSAANTDLYKDDVHCVLLPYTLMSQMLRILSIETDDEKEYWSPLERLQLSGLQGFCLMYDVAWPVSLVLDRKTLTCYQMIFRHLFYCKHVEQLLCRVWVSNKTANGFPVSTACSYSSAFALRQRMLNFIQNLEYYMMFEVIERNWHSFDSKMKDIENVDEVLMCHSDFLNSCLKDCMLTSPELLRIVSKLTGLCVSFSEFILNPSEQVANTAATMHEESSSFEQIVARFDLQFTGMLVTLVQKISDMGKDNYNDALVNVLYRLDFNNYYTERLEELPVATSPEASLEYMSGPPSG